MEETEDSPKMLPTLQHILSKKKFCLDDIMRDGRSVSDDKMWRFVRDDTELNCDTNSINVFLNISKFLWDRSPKNLQI